MATTVGERDPRAEHLAGMQADADASAPSPVDFTTAPRQLAASPSIEHGDRSNSPPALVLDRSFYYRR
jgi:hypothetical protein